MPMPRFVAVLAVLALAALVPTAAAQQPAPAQTQKPRLDAPTATSTVSQS